MFSYYGSKSKIVNYYPPPKYSKIIEPFCGSGELLKFCNELNYKDLATTLLEKILRSSKIFVEKY